MKLNNKKNKDGSINSFKDTGISGTGYSVPFTDPSFIEEIEEYILPAVLNLNLKGYPTVTSCQGHGIFNYIFNSGVSITNGPNITLQVNRNEVPFLEKHFNTFLIKTAISDSMEESEGKVNLRITSRLFISLFFTNKFLCKRIETLVKQL